MFKNVIPLAIAAILAAGAVGCANNDRGGGGGGTSTVTERERANTNTMNERQGTGTTTTGQVKSNATLGDNLSGEGKGLAEAYSRTTWVHSNLVARDWERALDDLHYVRDHVDNLIKDADVPKDAKVGLASLKTDITKLDASIRKHDAMAIQQSRALVNKFATDLEKPMMTGWMGEHKGGGAGAGTMLKHDTMKK